MVHYLDYRYVLVALIESPQQFCPDGIHKVHAFEHHKIDMEVASA